jgi:hypothetical protein
MVGDGRRPQAEDGAELLHAVRVDRQQAQQAQAVGVAQRLEQAESLVNAVQRIHLILV